MAHAGSILETEKGSTTTTSVDISGELHVEALQTLKAPESQIPAVMTVADDCVFYSEDEIPRPAFGTSAFVPVWPAGFESASQVLDLGTEESVQSVCGSVGLKEEGPMHHSAFKMKDAENPIGNKINYASSPVTIQPAGSESEPAANSSAARTDELLAVHQAMSATGEAAQLRLEDRTQTEKSVLAHVQTEAPAELQSEQAGGTQWSGESSDALERVGKITLTGSGSSGDERGVYSVSNGNGVGDRLNISFNHLTHEKYGTVSYKQIRRGHTRQRIQEFESRMQL